MNSQQKISTFVVMLMVSFTVNAEKIYERTDSQGVTEFSDQPSPDSEVVDVKPNVVNVVPPVSLEPRPAAAVPASPVLREQDRVQGEEVDRSVYYDDDEVREGHRKEHFKKEHRKEGVEHRKQKKAGVHRR